MLLILEYLWWFGLQADFEYSESWVHHVLQDPGTAYPNLARGNILFCWVFSVHSRRGWDEGCSVCCYVQSHCFMTLNAAYWTSLTLLYRTFTALTAQAFYHISCSSLSSHKWLFTNSYLHCSKCSNDVPTLRNVSFSSRWSSVSWAHHDFHYRVREWGRTEMSFIFLSLLSTFWVKL